MPGVVALGAVGCGKVEADDEESTEQTITQALDTAKRPQKTAKIKSYSIDFVKDCGADPTGTYDSAPALKVAVAKALAKKDSPPYAAKNDFTLHVPPGIYLMATSIGVQDMAGISTFRIEGHRAASIFLIACGDTAQAVVGFANQISAEIDGITFLGDGDTSAVDCAGILDIASTYQTIISNVQIHAVVAAYYGIITEGFGAVQFRNCFSANSACAAATGGIWLADGARAVFFEDCAFVDPAWINGSPGPSQGVNRTGLHKNTICVRGAARHIQFRGVLVDEACVTGILIGDGVNQIGVVEADGLFINVPAFLDGIAGLRVRKARSVTVRGLDHGTYSRVPAVMLEAVDRADLRNVRKETGSTRYMITADDRCKYLRIADVEGFSAADVSADPAIPIKFMDQFGSVADL